MAEDTSLKGGSVRSRFVATIFTGSFLLFLVQPMIARMALPRLGGAPSVWNSAMLVYQALLLAGYAYAHWLGRLPPPRQAMVHFGVLVLAGLTLPIGLLGMIPPPDANPFLWVPWLLILSIGPLFFAVSAQAPLLQRWFALEGGQDPYPLYAASNLGSFGGLIAYPLLVEPLLGVGQQRWLWSVGYALLVLLVGWCGLRLPKAQAAEKVEDSPRPDSRKIASWIILAAVPSGLILSTTLHLTTDLVAMPLLWVLPLGAYLLSFTVAFAERRGPADMVVRLTPLLLLFACFSIYADQQSWLVFLFGGASIVALFAISVSLHSRLFETRPAPRHLTLFYLAMSVGGVLGGLFGALIAPLIFNWTYEHLLLLIAAAWLIRTNSPFERFATLWNGDEMARRMTIAGIAVVAFLAVLGKGPFGLYPPSHAMDRFGGIAIVAIAIFAIGNRALFTAAVAALLVVTGGWETIRYSATPGRMTRSFFGIYSVRDLSAKERSLVHGTTLHGLELLGSPERERTPTTYYAPLSGVGLAMKAVPQLYGPNARIAVIGLGAGTLSCYARPGQDWSFYEIDPAIIRIARDPGRFRFVSRCKPDAHFKLGDARLLVERDPSGSADLLAVDAFSSDSVPMHLLTREAFADYGRLLSPRGLLMVHISNRYLDLKPVVAAAAAAGGWSAAIRRYRPGPDGYKRYESGSNWIAMSRSRETLDALVKGSGQPWSPLTPKPGFAPWTDDHASVLPLISLSGT